MIKELHKSFYDWKVRHDSKYIDSSLFTDINADSPLCLNHNRKHPHMLHTEELKGGLLIDGTSERAVHGASTVYLSQLLTYREKKRGFIAFLDDDADFAESIFGVAAYYGKKGTVLLIDDDNTDSITALLLRVIVQNGGYVIVRYTGASGKNAKSRQASLRDFIRKVAEVIKTSSIAEDHLFTILFSAPFFQKHGLLKIIPALDKLAEKAGWGRIVADGKLALEQSEITLDYDRHMCFASTASSTLSKHRKRLKDNEYLMLHDGTLQSKRPERGMSFFVRDYDFKTYSPVSRERMWTDLK